MAQTLIDLRDLDIKIPSYLYRDSHYKYKTIAQPDINNSPRMLYKCVHQVWDEPAGCPNIHGIRLTDPSTENSGNLVKHDEQEQSVTA